jgi:hypothetical protein
MNEPKRRGRPPKAAPEVALMQAEMRQGVELSALGSSDINPAQVYANRVWAGQSPSLPYGERWYRVKLALEAQGLSMDGVELK